MDGVRTSLLRHMQCWHSHCQSRYSSTVTSCLPRKIKDIFDDGKAEPLQTRQLNRILSFVRESRPHSSQRSALIKCLHSRKAHKDVVLVAKSALFDFNHNLQPDVSAYELKKYFSSLLSIGKSIQMEQAMFQLIKQFSLTNKSMVTNVINATFVQSTTTESVSQALLTWVRFNNYLHGHADFTNYEQYKYILKTLLFFLRAEKPEPHVLAETLNFVNFTQGPLITSQFASTLIYLSCYNRDFSVTESLWNYKREKEYPIIKSDLTSICKAYAHFEKFEQIQAAWSEFPDAQDDAQFDYLLIAHAKLQDWGNLQNQFNALFGIGDLPSINHYGIVMFSIAHLGESEMVEKLYNQLLRRKMIPTLPVLQSLLQVCYKTGDMNGCFQHFELFKKYGIKPTPSTCNIMLRIFRNLSDIDGSLRFLKRMTENGIEVSEKHFSTIINTCAKTTNYAIAGELFQVMKDDYDIKPTGSSVAALMHVYIKSDLPQEALKVFKEYRYTKAPLESEISIYNKAVEAYMRMNRSDMSEKIFEQILSKNLPADSEFYRVMIKHSALYMKDFETAENILTQLLSHSKLKATPTHFEALMGAYDKYSNRRGVLDLYQRMLENNVPVNSKVLFYLIKATFKTRLRSREDLDEAISLVDDIMSQAANRTLDITFEKLHPSVMAWPMRAAAKYHSPLRALELMNKYNDMFFDKTDSAESRLVVIRSLMVLSAEVHQWDDFQKFFERYMNRIQYYQNLPSATVRNRNFASLLRGVLTYKIKHLVATNRATEIPALLEDVSAKNFVIDNEAWNEAITSMFADMRTIGKGLQAVDTKLIHGFNLIHKYRLLRNKAASNTSTDRGSWFLEKKRQAPSSYQPKLYLKSNVLEKTFESMDNYLSTISNVESELKDLTSRFKYYMKRYLMHPRNKIPGWNEIEVKHVAYFQKLRDSKRAISPEELSF
ncbi:hypothetical protein ACU8KH_05428 [Lachancea thermotolerans]